MSGKFTHYLITRFNVPVKNWDRDKAGKPVLDAAWMQERLVLFRKYCAPTIRHQQCNDFIWMVYCDQLTEAKDLETIRQEVSRVKNAQVRLVADFPDLLIDLKEVLTDAPTPFVITSRVDNDDGLGPDFIREVQDHFVARDKQIINFTKGVLYDTHRQVLTEIRDSRFNHYGSLIEESVPGQPLITVVGYPHGRPPEGSNVTDVDSRFAWLKIIHERNMSSRTNGMPLLELDIPMRFGLQPGDLPQSLTSTAVFVLHRLLSRLKRKLFKA